MASDKLGLKGKDAPPILTIIAVVILVLIVGAGGFFVYNGGWKTAGQQDEDYKHNLLPIMAAKHGDMGPFEEENKLRKSKGQPPLEMPKDKQQNASDANNSLSELQKKLGGGQSSAPAGQ
jgi:hypothetical protein